MIIQKIRKVIELLTDNIDKPVRKAGKTRFILLATLVGASFFLSASFILSPKAFSQKYTEIELKGASSDSGAKEAQQPPLHRYDFKLSETDTFNKVISNFNLTPAQSRAVIEKANAVYDLRSLKKGEVLRVLALGDRIDSIEYRINDLELLRIRQDDRASEGFSAERVELPHEMRTMTVSGVIQNSLYEDGLKAGADAQGIMNFSDIFAWDVDFAADIRKGDTFKIFYETLYVDGKYMRTGNILGAEMVNDGRKFTAIYYRDSAGRSGYYDQEGHSLRRMLLKSPLRFSRITSRFTNSRFHPILKMYRPHHGVDYAAPTGTPVEASGNGRVTFAGWKSGYGNFIELRHPNGYVTGYGHLSRIAKGIAPGRAVEQGSIIGYVGSTGISTGPHLHYEIKVNGSLMNPLRIKAQPNKAIDKKEMARFNSARDAVLAKLDAANATLTASNANTAVAAR